MYHGNLAASIAGPLSRGRPVIAWNVRQSLYDISAEKRLNRYVIRANRLLGERADAIIYNSEISRSQHETFGFETARAQVIPNGFDLKRLVPDTQMGALVRTELGLPGETLVIGQVSRFHPMKDHASFLRAAVTVARGNNRVRFLVIGRDVTPNNPALAGIVPADLLDRFHFTGERSDSQRLMRAMDLFCLSSWSEAFPNVLGEAMSCGVPCVTTDVGDSAAIVGETGIVVRPSDSEALARGLWTMVDKTDRERRALGQAARARIETNFALDSMVEHYARLYRDLVGYRRGEGA
jgi:glycosyltransferase involved in cell wall biosynthesis